MIRRKKRENKTQSEITNVAKKLLESKNYENDFFGKYLSQQLQSVRSDQKIIAEKLMSDILYFARMNQLNEDSSIITHAPYYDYSPHSS